MKKLYVYLFAILVAGAMGSCIMEDIADAPKTDGKDVNAEISLTIPGGFSVAYTRQMDDTKEKAVSTVDVLVFSNDATPKLEQIIPVTSISQDGAAIEMVVKLPAGGHNIVAVANAHSLMSSIAVDNTYDVVQKALVETITGKMYSSDGPIPMWGESGVKTITADTELALSLYRSIARIDVGEGVWNSTDGWPGLSNFEMTEVYVMRPNNKYAVIPTELDASKVPDAPTVPAEATRFSVADSKSKFVYSDIDPDGFITSTIYVPESDITDASVTHETRMALVIGGKYRANGGTPWGGTTYYRVDFNGTSGLIDVVRNHLYRFSIKSVGGPGLADVETAYEAQSSNMTAAVIDWTDVPFDNIEFGNGKYLAVRGIPAELDPVKDATHTVTISTDVDEFTMTTGTGADARELKSATAEAAGAPGQSVSTADFTYKLTGSAGNYTLLITTNDTNVGGSADFEDEWEIDADGLLTFDLTVTQPFSATDPTPHAIAVSAGTGGTIVSNRATAVEGDAITIQATASQGMVFSGWSSPDSSVTITAAMQQSPKLELTMPAKDIAIKADFMASEVKFELSTGTVTFSSTNLAANGVFADSARAYGALFQWGSSTAYTYTGGTDPSMAYTNTNATWPAAENPCPAGWRLPTNVEWANMLNLASGTAAATAVAGSFTTITPFADGVLKLTPKTGDTGQTLILPAAGIRNGSSVSGRGIQGLFWSSVESISTAGRGVDFDGTDYPSGRFNTYNKFRAFSVRCVRAASGSSTSNPVSAVASPAVGGTVTVKSADTGTVITESVASKGIVFTATPTTGYVFKGWTVTKGSQPFGFNAANQTLSVSMTNDELQLTATFESSVTPPDSDVDNPTEDWGDEPFPGVEI